MFAVSVISWRNWRNIGQIKIIFSVRTDICRRSRVLYFPVSESVDMTMYYTTVKEFNMIEERAGFLGDLARYP